MTMRLFPHLDRADKRFDMGENRISRRYQVLAGRRHIVPMFDPLSRYTQLNIGATTASGSVPAQIA